MTTRLSVARLVDQIREELDRIVEAESSLSGDLDAGSALTPRIDVVETELEVCLLVELPGVPARQLEATVIDNVLTIRGTKEPASAPARGGRFLRVERQWGSFERSVPLPSAVNTHRGRASLENGILRIEFPLLTDQRKRTYRLRIVAGEGETLE